MRTGERVLVTGAAGYLGWFVAGELCRRGYLVVGTSRDGEGMPEGVEAVSLQLDDGGSTAAELVARLRPAVILHLAALSSPDDCARDPERAQRVNGSATGALARAAAGCGGYLVYTSTDLVFDGTRAPYREEDPPGPMGPYMATKVLGEQEVLAVSEEFLVARVALLYGRRGGRKGSFSDWLLQQATRGQSATLFTDQWRTPAEVEDAASILADLLERRPGGLLHLGGPERVSRYEHGLALVQGHGLDGGVCQPIQVQDLPHLAPRPADASLCIGRLCEVLGRAPLGIEAGCSTSASRPGSVGSD